MQEMLMLFALLTQPSHLLCCLRRPCSAGSTSLSLHPPDLPEISWLNLTQTLKLLLCPIPVYIPASACSDPPTLAYVLISAKIAEPGNSAQATHPTQRVDIQMAGGGQAGRPEGTVLTSYIAPK